jgi:hypothetical protein
MYALAHDAVSGARSLAVRKVAIAVGECPERPEQAIVAGIGASVVNEPREVAVFPAVFPGQRVAVLPQLHVMAIAEAAPFEGSPAAVDCADSSGHDAPSFV